MIRVQNHIARGEMRIAGNFLDVGISAHGTDASESNRSHGRADAAPNARVKKCVSSSECSRCDLHW